MSDQTLAYYLALSHICGIGATTVARLKQQLGSVAAIFSADMSELVRYGLNSAQAQAIRKFQWQAIDRALHWAQQSHQHILHPEDHRYPPLLREIYQAPLVLYVRGSVEVLSQPQLAIVGSRHPTPIGKENAYLFADALTDEGLIVSSGLALGIDSAGHRGALRRGRTIAVLGHGFSYVYPSCHAALAEEIVEQGALVSEFGLSTPPQAKNFPRRNRIISGLSLGVLVVEAALKSGSLISARYALEQNREVFAIPSSIHNTLARGCHQLIRQGAKLVETTTDIIEELSLGVQSTAVDTEGLPSPFNLEKKYGDLLACIDDQATSIETILSRSQYGIETLTSMLVELELHGFIRPVTGGYCRLASSIGLSLTGSK